MAARISGSGSGGFSPSSASNPELLLSSQACDASVSVGDWVRWNGSTLVRAIADSLDNANVFGVCEAKPTSTTANVRVGGVTAAIFSGLDNAKTYFLSDAVAGWMTKQGVNIPTDPGHIVLTLGRPVDGQKFLVQPGIRIMRS